jgi:hypothetical protein
MLDYSALRAVAAVVQTGGFEKGARVLNVTPSAISQRVKQLEERLGTVLIERGSPCVATEQGEWLCRHMESRLSRGAVSHRVEGADSDVGVERRTRWPPPCKRSLHELEGRARRCGLQHDGQTAGRKRLQRERLLISPPSLRSKP